MNSRGLSFDKGQVGTENDLVAAEIKQRARDHRPDRADADNCYTHGGYCGNFGTTSSANA